MGFDELLTSKRAMTGMPESLIKVKIMALLYLEIT